MEAIRRRVIVVDDDPGIRRYLQELLKLNGWESVVVGSAEEALGVLAAAGRFDLAVLDLNLPGRSGADLAWEIRKEDRETAILVVSGSLESWDLGDLIDLGVDRVLGKPFSRNDFNKAAVLAMAERRRKIEGKTKAHDLNVETTSQGG